MDNIIIEKVINNNIISAYEESGAEVIVMGRGIGFKKKQGEAVPADQISKIFRIKSRTLTEQFKELLANMPLERVRISDEIISHAKDHLKLKLKNYYSSYDKSQIIAFTAPKTPSLKAQAVSGHKVKLTGKPIPAAYQNGKCEYVIYYRNAKDKNYQRLTKLSDTKGSYTTKALKKNNTYYFRMRSSICDENGNHSTTGTYSNTVKVTVK